MPSAPPSFGSQEYWNKRFTSDPNPFEWLEAPNSLDPYIIDALQRSEDLDPQLLHIGCGTSLLSYHLRTHVESPKQIHNLDYSDIAIEVGRKREISLFRAQVAASEETKQSHNGFLDKTSVESSQTAIISEEKKLPVSVSTTDSAPMQSYMRWASANLLDHASLLQVCQTSTYSVVVDKSTSDSIACSDDLYVPLPHRIVTSSKSSSETAITQSPEPLHPLHVMAVHLALVTKPRGRWISLSYSTDRYPFLQLPAPMSTNGSSQPVRSTTTSHASQQVDHANKMEGVFEDKLSLDGDLDNIPQKFMHAGFPDPSTLWRLVGKYDIEPHPAPGAPNDNQITHRPKVLHWIYVLERTDVPLFVRT